MGIEQPAIQLYSETVAGISLVFMLFCQTCLDPIDVPNWHAKEKTREEKMVFLLPLTLFDSRNNFLKMEALPIFSGNTVLLTLGPR